MRLFDIVRNKACKNANDVMLAEKIDGNWKTHTYFEVWNTAKSLALGLSNIGITNEILEPISQKKVAIISANRPEWIITDIGTQLTGSVLTPIYPTINTEEMAYILTESETSVVFVANLQIYNRFKEAFNSVPTLKYVYSFDDIPGVKSWKELCKKPVDEQNTNFLPKITEDTLATIIYTSGTTGNPKGVMLTHKNIVSNVNSTCESVFSFVTSNAKTLSFLPLNHVFERMVTYVYIKSGVAIYYAEDMGTIAANLKEVKPIVFTTVPRLLEKVYEKIMATGSTLTGFKKLIFDWSINVANSKSNSIFHKIQLNLADKLVYQKWREALGGDVKAIVVGSAACQERLVRIFTAAKLVIMEGYGLTETSPVLSVNRYEESGRRIGTVGKLLDGIQLKFAEDGEILVKGDNITIGYFKHPELNPFDNDGWFHTGDIGVLEDNTFLKITDRKKELLKTSCGKYVAPQVVENKMKESEYIDQMMLIGNNRKFVAALVVPSIPNLRKYIKEEVKMNLTQNDSEFLQVPIVKDFLFHQIEQYNKSFSPHEQVKRIALLPNQWTVDSGELTPSMKIKRKVIENKFSIEIENLYN